MDCSLPGSSVHGILQARILEWVAIPFSRDLPDPEITPMSQLCLGQLKKELSRWSFQSLLSKPRITEMWHAVTFWQNDGLCLIQGSSMSHVIWRHEISCLISKAMQLTQMSVFSPWGTIINVQRSADKHTLCRLSEENDHFYSHIYLFTLSVNCLVPLMCGYVSYMLNIWRLIP